MKAKDYLVRFRQDERVLGFDTARKVLYELMFAEILQIIKDRHCQYAGAVESVLNEMNDRWNAMVKNEPRLVRDFCHQPWYRELDRRDLFKLRQKPTKDPVDTGVFE